METIIWCFSLLFGFFAEMLTLFFYLSHDDLDRGKIIAYELT